MRAVTRSHRSERGASLVEFAIVLPLFLLLIGGMVDFGRAFYTKVMLTNAAREGARSAMYSGTASNTCARAFRAAGADPTKCPTTPSLTVTVENPCPATPGPNAQNVTVSVSDSNFKWILIKPAMAMFGANLAEPHLTGEATMQCGG